jgi:peptidoglycan/LPS O-acetylase OafA/YrhL
MLEQVAEPGDDWGTRIAKLIPAEALGLYGTAVGLVSSMKTGDKTDPLALVVIALACALLIVIIRYRATRDPETGAPQPIAIAVALISFAIWLWALGATETGISPLPSDPARPWPAPLAALLWGAFVPYFYKGD